MALNCTSKWKPLQIATRIAGCYVIVGLFWSWLGGQTFSRWVSDSKGAHGLENVTFVLASATGIWFMVRFYALRMTDAHRLAQETQRELVNRLAIAAEYRDDMTGGHNRRMSLYCGALSEACGLGKERSELVGLAAALHDVGKIGISDAILNKPGALTPEERATMETHVDLGACILEGAWHPLIQVAHRIALTHHEAWDGSGYPNGLKGDEIPIEGRIASVCDTFDALTSERPYKEAWPVPDAVAEIQRQCGKRFDPAVVEAFLMIVPQLVAIRKDCDAAEDHRIAPIEPRSVAEISQRLAG